ncbi:sensor histidine kinase [Hugenholtzia roseola]|uniref:sensor histidine kinase n=1 Tax=Hugenholtzia roseola TaxID=1002 RepID=UPI001378377C|nr:histidine kinase [Hugenholtzia roseola]
MPSETIYDLHTDEATGALYLGTDIGVFSFNGTNFRKIDFENQLSNSATDIFVDAKNRLWCRNFSNQIFVQDSITKKLNLVPFHKEIPNQNLISKISFHQNLLWILYGDAFFVADTEKMKIIYKYKTNEKSIYFNSIYTYKKNIFVFYSKKEDNSTKKFVIMATLKNNKIDIKNIKTNNNLYENLRFAFLEKENITTTVSKYLNPSTTLLELKFQEDTVEIEEKYSIVWKNKNNENITINSLFSYQKDYYWACSNDGLWILKPSDSQKKYPLLTLEAEQILPQLRVSDLCQDYQGHYWVATLDNGLYCIPSLSVYQYQNKSNYKMLYATQNRLFASTPSGRISEIDPINGEEKSFLTHLKNIQPPFIFYNPTDKTVHTGYQILDTNFNIFSENTNIYYRAIIFDKDKNYYGASNNNIVNFSLKKINKSTLLEEKKIIDEIRVKSLLLEKKALSNKRRLWVAALRAVFVYENLDSAHILKREILSCEGKSINATRLVQDSLTGRIWVGTTQQGVFVFENTRCVAQIGTSEKLKEEVIRQMEVAGEWLYVLAGTSLWRVHLRDYRVEKVALPEQIGIPYLNSFAVQNGYLWVCSPLGIIYFRLSEEGNILSSQTIKPKINIVSATISDAPLSYFRYATTSDTSNEIAAKEKYGVKNTFPYEKNNLFILLDPIFFISNNFKIYYRLWRNTDLIQQGEIGRSSPSLSFAALDYGVYEVEILMQDLDNQSFSDEIHFYFQIEKPFWWQNWFLSLSLFLLLLIVFGIVRLVQEQTQKRELLKQQIIESQMQALRSQMNPHFLYNVLGSLQGLIYSNKINEASDYISHFSTHLRYSLHFSNQIEISIKEEIESIQTYLSLERLRFGEDFFFKIKVNSDLDTSLFLPSMIVQPFVENAVKHGLLHKKAEKLLLIYFTFKNKNLLIEIQDNGIGREASQKINAKRYQKRESFALKAIDSRIELLNKKRKNPISLKIEDLKSPDGVALGTRVQLIIPLDK